MANARQEAFHPAAGGLGVREGIIGGDVGHGDDAAGDAGWAAWQWTLELSAKE
jgi:hypothetical protein